MDEKVYKMQLYLDLSTSTFETKASYSWLNTHYISSWRKKVYQCNFTLMYQPQHWDKSIIFLIEYMLYQFMKEKSLSNVTLPWCIHTNIWDESIIFLIDSRPSSTHFDTEASRRFLVRYLTTHNTSDFTHRFLDQKFC